jgi:hypothetical protein
LHVVLAQEFEEFRLLVEAAAVFAVGDEDERAPPLIV